MRDAFVRERIRVNSRIVSQLRSHKGKVVLAVVAVVAALAWHSARDSIEKRDARGGKTPETAATVTAPGGPGPTAQVVAGPKFDFYLFAMTVHAAFCADGHEQQRECRSKQTWPLVIHGLWPENLAPRTYPHDCPAPPLALDRALEAELAPFMPGMAEGLHQHEWREHGGCSGLDDDQYFRAALNLARDLETLLASRLTTLQGEVTDAAALRETADLFGAGVGKTFTLHCRTLRGSGGKPVLMEIRQCVDNDGPGGAPGTPLDCASVERRDQGCGGGFMIAGEAR
jgi:ribonuclease I